jgi:hypothetical protein
MKSTAVLIVAFLISSIGINAQKMTIANKTATIVEVMLIPKGIMQLSKRKKGLALKNRFARIKPGKSVRLKADNLESIDVKVFSKSRRSIKWYKYDNISAHNLLDMIKSSQKKIKFSVVDPGDKYEVKIDEKKTEGSINQFSRIFR